MQNKRKEPRLRMRRNAQYHRSAEAADTLRGVVILNSGARLAIARQIMTLPPRFVLQLDKGGRVQRKCEVVWIDASFVGVKFI